MRPLHGVFVALLALGLTTTCMMKSEAPEQATVDNSLRYGGDEAQGYADRTTEEGEARYQYAFDGDEAGPAAAERAAQNQPRARVAAASPPPPPGSDEDSDDAPAMAMAKEEASERRFALEPAARTRAEKELIDELVAITGTEQGESHDAISGLSLRGAGQGGGGEGFGRIHGMGRVDTGGGEGRGPAKSSGKKKLERAAAPDDVSLTLDGYAAAAPAKPKPKPAPRRPRAVQLGQDVGAETLEPAEELDEEEPALEQSGEADKTPPEQAARFMAADQKAPAGGDFGESKLRWRNERTRDARGDDWGDMLTPLDESEVDGRFEVAEYAERFVAPDGTLPRMCYFENTYLGGNAAYTERLRKLDDALPRGRQPYRAAALPRQPFDAPDDAGLALTATLDRPYVDQPQRVFLQVGLQGSKRFGWRRPPLDIALVVDGLARYGDTLVDTVTALSRRLGPQDRLAVVIADARPIVLSELGPLRDRLALARAIEALEPTRDSPPDALYAAMTRAGAMLRTAGESARIPGTQTVLVLTRGAPEIRISMAREAAHALTVQGAVTSVIQLGGSHQGWWQVANAGHGNYHRAPADGLDEAVDAELGSISRVIARLLRVNVKLADGVEAIRVVGSRVLGQQEVKQVKAREEATDRNLSKTMGVKADRGDDDDGIQTVIPYFYGGDSHVILVELWVTRPGAVAEISLKYKDMVALKNATARVAAEVDRVPRPLTPAERRVAYNVRGFRLAEGLSDVARLADRGDVRSALVALDGLDGLALGRDRRMVEAFEALMRQRGADGTVADALRMAHDRRIGHSP